ncbi:MAG: CRISPR-associated helicase Cas3' [Rhabdochlamydiaceae bacterium]
MKTSSELLKTEYGSKVFAHTSIKKNSETLIDHSEKTLKYCKSLIDVLTLEKNFNKMLLQLIPKELIPLFLDLISSIVCHHDLGKINPVFQKEKMRNNLNIPTGILSSRHSFYGKVLFDNLFYDDFETELKRLNVTGKTRKKSYCLFYLLSQTIDRHHSSLKDIDLLANNVRDESVKQELNDLNTIANQIIVKWLNFNPDTLSSFYTFKEGERYDVYQLFDPEQREALFYLYKTVYSLLILSDYYATLDYMHMPYFDRISVITPELKEKCQKNFYEFKFNKKLNDKNHCRKLLNSDIAEITELNDIRTRILLESDDQLEKILEKQPEQRIFYLNVPTGGGKTNVSLKLALTILKLRSDIKKIFYVFPFINIIEQNHSIIKKTLGLDEELSAVYSTSIWNMESGEKDEHLQYILDNDFLNYPFVVISNVNFFNAFVKSGKASNYRLINLSNSIVIIDEIQSLNDKDWTLFNDLIEFGSKYLNIYFIIMSATLPRLNVLLDVTNKNHTANLITKPDSYFNHPLFKNRVSIEYRDAVNNLDEMVKILTNEINDKTNKILFVVNTIKNSLEAYKKIKSNQGKQILGRFSVYLLNSTILPHRRREIIEKMEEKGNKFILISTQSVEAGVDIDCDFGIRDFSIFDSIEQIAGRINRNSNDKIHSAKLIITNLKDGEERIASYVYDDSYRWETMENSYKSSEDIEKFLKERNFDKFYGKVLENIKIRDSDSIRESSLGIVEKGIRGLNFYELNKIDIIKQDSISLIVNSEISDKKFSDAELNFIRNAGILCQDKISGKSVWQKYNEFIKNFQSGYVDKKINTKIWSSILSKFSINIRNYYVGENQKLSDIIDRNKGIPLLKKEYYSDEEGMDPELLDYSQLEFPDNTII